MFTFHYVHCSSISGSLCKYELFWNQMRHRNKTEEAEGVCLVFCSEFTSILFIEARTRKALVNVTSPARTFISAPSPVSNIIVQTKPLHWTPPFPKSWGITINGNTSFCKTWLKLDNWFWSYHLHLATHIQRVSDCKTLISPGEDEWKWATNAH